MMQPGHGGMPELEPMLRGATENPAPPPPPDPTDQAGPLQRRLDAFLATHEAELIAFRQDLHTHPELGFEEHRTTQAIVDRLTRAGLEPTLLPKSGLICDIGPGDGPTVALRADID